MAAPEPTGDLLETQALMYHNAFAIVKSMALKSAVDLDIPDIIHRRGRPVALSELQAELQMVGEKGDALRRLMRLLVHMGCFSSQRGGDDQEEDTYDLTAFSRLFLKSSTHSSAAPILDFTLSPFKLTMWGLLGAWFKGDQPTAFHMLFGKSMWETAAEDQAFNKLVNELMASDSRLVVDALVSRCGDTFQGLRSLVDVAGGTGSTARAIAAAFPGIKCAVYDLPHVVATAPEGTGVGFIGGDMFEHIPHADAILLKWILHDWSDEDCVKILKRCKEAIPPREDGGKVIVIDMVVNSRRDDPKITETQYCFDMSMILTCGGKERDEGEWQKIFVAAGFSDYKIKHNLGLRSLIEVYP